MLVASAVKHLCYLPHKILHPYSKMSQKREEKVATYDVKRTPKMA